MGKNEVRDRIMSVYEDIIESGELRYEGSFTEIDYFGLFCKATLKDKLFKFLGVDVCMFNCVHEKDDAVMILFSIPLSTESSTKQVADRVMEVIELMELCFVTVDHISSREAKGEKFVYVMVIKKGKK